MNGVWLNDGRTQVFALAFCLVKKNAIMSGLLHCKKMIPSDLREILFILMFMEQEIDSNFQSWLKNDF